MKTKPLKALEPGFQKNRSIRTFNILIATAFAFLLGALAGSMFIGIAKDSTTRQQSATIARQQLIIDTLKGDTTSYIVDHSEIKRDQEGD